MQEGEIRIVLRPTGSSAKVMRCGTVQIISVEEALDLISKHNASRDCAIAAASGVNLDPSDDKREG